MWCSYGRRRFESDWNRNRTINIVHMASAQWNRAARTFCTTSDILAYRSQQEVVRNKLLLCLHLQCHNFIIWSPSARLINKNSKCESIVCVETAPLFSSRLSAELNKARHVLTHPPPVWLNTPTPHISVIAFLIFTSAHITKNKIIILTLYHML